MNTNYLTKLYDNPVIRPYVSQLVDEIKDHYPNGYVTDTYKHLLDLNIATDEKADLGNLEEIICSYLLRGEK